MLCNLWSLNAFRFDIKSKFCISRDAASGIYAELRGLKPAEFVATERIRRYICASIWFGSSLLLAISTGGIGIVIKYLGSVASANIFIYPGK